MTTTDRAVEAFLAPCPPIPDGLVILPEHIRYPARCRCSCGCHFGLGEYETWDEARDAEDEIGVCEDCAHCQCEGCPECQDHGFGDEEDL